MFAAINLNKYFQKLAENSWVVISVDKEFALGLLASCKSKLTKFKKATVSESTEVLSHVRSDQIYWLDHNQVLSCETDQKLLLELSFLKESLREFFRIHLSEFECHFSHYQPGQAYMKHRDTTSSNNKRIFSFVIYLNEDWKIENGGQLVGYSNDQILFEINPSLGTMIIFKSDIEHEVFLSHKDRYALTGWMRK